MGVRLATTPVARCPSAVTPRGVLERTNLLVAGSFVREVQIFGSQWTIRRRTQRFVRPDVPTLATTGSHGLREATNQRSWGSAEAIGACA